MLVWKVAVLPHSNCSSPSNYLQANGDQKKSALTFITTLHNLCDASFDDKLCETRHLSLPAPHLWPGRRGSGAGGERRADGRRARSRRCCGGAGGGCVHPGPSAGRSVIRSASLIPRRIHRERRAPIPLISACGGLAGRADGETEVDTEKEINRQTSIGGAYTRRRRQRERDADGSR